jgi:hypothetical protein
LALCAFAWIKNRKYISRKDAKKEKGAKSS